MYTYIYIYIYMHTHNISLSLYIYIYIYTHELNKHSTKISAARHGEAVMFGSVRSGAAVERLVQLEARCAAKRSTSGFAL